MYRKQVNEKSPLRILERSTHGGLGPGNLGVVMARAGVGKTAFLVQIGLDDAMRERPVLHVALGQELEHVQAWYDALFEDLASVVDLEEREGVRGLVAKNRVIQAYGEHKFSPERLDEVVKLYGSSMKFEPKAVLIDGFEWEGGDAAERGRQLGAFRATAKRLGAELWMTAQTHRSVTTAHPKGLTPPCEAHAKIIDVAVFLEPEGSNVTVRLLKDHDNDKPSDTHLQLHADTMRLATDDMTGAIMKLPPRSYMLLSGGAPGAEVAFGEAAERWGVGELTFSFPGRETNRRRGLVELTADELRRGEVSETYIKAQLHRTFPRTEMFQNLLKSIWHQVATAGEVFVVGEILDDGTVKGGTGWGAELARHFQKRLYVFDQVERAWFRWRDGEWKPEKGPRIRSTRFTGTGTRFLSDEGKQAVAELFERSFGKPPK